mmetsp:Transcript_42495/g.102364  ORF Transcript_42495/g.102364 Transcript_42495/m.102364 type:complete len:205 (+) Transcript_42495:1786-2400(+)
MAWTWCLSVSLSRSRRSSRSVLYRFRTFPIPSNCRSILTIISSWPAPDAGDGGTLGVDLRGVISDRYTSSACCNFDSIVNRSCSSLERRARSVSISALAASSSSVDDSDTARISSSFRSLSDVISSCASCNFLETSLLVSVCSLSRFVVSASCSSTVAFSRSTFARSSFSFAAAIFDAINFSISVSISAILPSRLSFDDVRDKT